MEKNSKAIWNRIGIDKLCLLAAAGVALLICSFPGQNSGRENKEVQTNSPQFAWDFLGFKMESLMSQEPLQS